VWNAPLAFSAFISRLNFITDAHVDKTLLGQAYGAVGPLLVYGGLDTEAWSGFEQLHPRGYFSLFLQLFQILELFGSALGVGYFSHLIGKEVFKFVLFKSITERLYFVAGHINSLTA